MFRRFGLAATAYELFQHFELHEIPDISPRYNIAPGQSIQAVLQDPNIGNRSLYSLQWGLIPSWQKQPKPLLNARAENLDELTFRTALRQRRCLIPSDGFFVWPRQGKRKMPLYVGLKNKSLFAFAGIWEIWKSLEGNVIHSCVIITTMLNEQMNGIYDYMPVILEPKDYALWLNPKILNPDIVVPLLRSYPYQNMINYPVSHRIYDPQCDDVSLREKVVERKMNNLEVGEVVIGTVRGIKPYGAFIDIGGMSGLLHISEISHEHIVTPHTVLNVNDEVKVMIIDLDMERGRISLSIKKLDTKSGNMAKDPKDAGFN